jgi:acetylornithine deacetylase/succinyl-diaminopimelate desuccinylase-like protein
MNRIILAALLALAASPCAVAGPDTPATPATTPTPSRTPIVDAPGMDDENRWDARARAIYAKLIGFETSVGKGQVPAMAAYLADEFRDAGFAESDIHVLPLGETASLVVRYPGNGTGGKPVLFMAHMDVVTAKREDWQRDPFKLIEENGFFYGRGTYDVKDGVASLATTFLRLKDENFAAQRDLVIVFSGDEETEMATIQDLVNHHRDLIDAEYALNSDGGGGTLGDDGRPLYYSLQTAEKTYASFELTVRNPGGHSSLPRADNAIYALADAIKAVQAHRFPTQWNDTTLAYFAAAGKMTPGALGDAMRAFAANPKDEAAIEVLAATPGEVGRTRTTCVPTLLRGGHAENALPQSATVTVNCRIFPGVAVEVVKQALRDAVGKDVEIATLGAPTASDASPLREDVLAAVDAAVHAIHPGVPIVPSQESGASDGLYLRAAGIPTYGVGGMFIKDSDAFAHGLDERVPVGGFYAGLQHWLLLAHKVGRPLGEGSR